MNRQKRRYSRCGAAAACLITTADAAAAADPEAEPEFEDTLTRDWDGARTALLDRGVHVEAENMTDVFASIRGGASDESSVSNLFEVAVTAELETLAGLPGGTFFLHGFGAHGDDPAEASGTIHAPGDLAEDEPVWRVAEAWYEQSLLDDRAGLLVGFYAADSEFDVRETADLFLNDGFDTGLELGETGRNADSIFALSGLGLRGRFEPSDDYTISIAIIEGVPGDLDDPTAFRIELTDGEGVFMIAEAEWRPPGFDFARVGVGAWRYTTEFQRLDGAGEQNGTGGAYFFAEGMLINGRGHEAQGLSGFVRIGRADQAVNRFDMHAAAGLTYTGLWPGRAEDQFGVGVSSVANGDDFMAVAANEGEAIERRETILEVTYLAQVLPWLTIQPSLQYAINPETDPEIENHLAAGLRFGVEF